MATSGSVDYNDTRTEIIEDAYQLIGVYGRGRTVSSEDMALGVRMFNRMIKSWQSQGLHLWAKQEGVLFITDNTGEYTLSSGSSDAYATTWDDAVITELNGAAAASASSLTVDSTTGMAASDNIGVVLDDDTIHWTTIVSVDSSTTLTITSGLASAAADNNNVYTFTTRLNKPLRITSCRRVSGIDSGATTTQTEIPLVRLSNQEYFELPSKTNNGLTNHFYYRPNRDDGTLFLWPRPDDPENYIRFTYERLLEDMDATTDNVDFPQEWLECIVYQLAVRLAVPFGREQKATALLAPIAAELLEGLKNWDSEVESVYMMPDLGPAYWN